MYLEQAIALIRQEVSQRCDVTAHYYDDDISGRKVGVSILVFIDGGAMPAFQCTWLPSVYEAYQAIIEQVESAREAVSS
jgi:hypothetical protein